MRFHRYSKKSKVVQGQPNWPLKVLCSALWRNRGFLFHAITLISIAGNVVTLAGALDIDLWQAISTFNDNAQVSVYQIIDWIQFLSQRPVLCVLINLILLPIVVKSGVLESSSYNNTNDHHYHSYYSSLSNQDVFVLDYVQESCNISDYHNIITSPNQQPTSYNQAFPSTINKPSLFTIEPICEPTLVKSRQQYLQAPNTLLHISPCSTSSIIQDSTIISSPSPLGASIPESMEIPKISSFNGKEDVIDFHRSSSSNNKLHALSRETPHEATIVEPLCESLEALGHVETIHHSSSKNSSSKQESIISHHTNSPYEAPFPSKVVSMESQHLQQHIITPSRENISSFASSKQHQIDQRAMISKDCSSISLDLSKDASIEDKPHNKNTVAAPQKELSMMLPQKRIVSSKKDQAYLGGTKSSKSLKRDKQVYYMDDIISRQEFNERVENFIFKFKRNLTMERQDSLNRLLSLIGTSEIRIAR